MAPRRRIALPERVTAPVEIPASLQKKKQIKNLDSVIAEAQKMSEKYKDEYICITDKDELIDYIDKIIYNQRAALDTETTGLDIFNDDVVGFSLHTEGKKACYVPIRHLSRLSGRIDTSQLSPEFCAQQLNRLQEVKDKIQLDYFNAQFDMNMLYYNLHVNLWDIKTNDAMLMMRMLDTERSKDNNLKALHADFCAHTTRGPRFNDLFPAGSFNVCPYRYATAYAARDAEMTTELTAYATEQMQLPENESLWHVWETIEQPLIPVLLRMREKGVLIDKGLKAELTEKYRKIMEDAERDFMREYEPYIPLINQWRQKYNKVKGKTLDMPIKIGSDDQIQILFWDIMKLPHAEGAKCDKEAIKATNSKIGEILLKYREAKKLLSTYLEGLDKFIQKDGCVHGGIKQLGAATGRTSACIAVGSQVSCKDGIKPIEEIKIGDIVYSYDDKINIVPTLCLRKVTNVFDKGIRDCIELRWSNSDDTLICTADHMIKTEDRGWIMADKIKEGDYVYAYNSEDHATFYKFKERVNTTPHHVYDLEVEGTHCFIANGVCVHNCDPNLQNIPSHNREIRQMYMARPGCYLISCDYSAQEPRLTACVSKDEGMIKAYQEGKDLYAMIASVAYNTTYEECLEKHNGELYLPGKERRSAAKSIVLGICYGRQIPSIAEQLGCSVEEAQNIYDKVTKNFPGLLRAQDEAIQEAHKYGYVSNLWGGRRHLSVMKHDDYEFKYRDGTNPEFDPYEPELTAEITTVSPKKAAEFSERLKKAKWRKDKEAIINELSAEGIEVSDYSYQKQEMGRKALNAIIQGSASAMSKLAMIAIAKDERLKNINTYLLLMIHDEVICECPKEHLAEAVKYIEEDMVKPTAQFPVPFKADSEVSDVWYGSDVMVDENGELIND